MPDTHHGPDLRSRAPARRSPTLFAAIGALTGAIFVADMLTPAAHPAPFLYIVPILLAGLAGWLPLAPMLGAVTIALTGLAYLVTPDGDPVAVGELRCFAIVLILTTAAVSYCVTDTTLSRGAATRRLERRVAAIRRITVRIRNRLRRVRVDARRAEQHARQAERRYRAVFEQTFQLSAILGPDGRVIEANQTLLLVGGLALEELVGRPLGDLPLWRDSPDGIRRIEAAVRSASGGNFSRDNLTCTRIGGDRMIVDFSIKPIRNRSGAVEMLIFEARDITDHRRDQAILAQRQRLEVIGTMTSGVAHDFNNLLTVIGGNMELAMRRITDSETAQARLDKATEAVFQGKALTQQLLAFARKQELDPRSTDMRDVVQAVTALVERTVPTTHSIRIELEENSKPCWVDSTQLQTALLNLILNATDAMPNGGDIVVRTTTLTIASREDRLWPDLAPGDYLRIDVVDEGDGIDEANLDRVIEPFFTTKPPGSGSGLGLSMVYGFVKQSGGDLRISSRRGEGTTVSLVLPCDDGENETGPAPPHETPPVRPARILLVEDDAEVRDVVVAMLTDLGYTVEQAGDGAEAVERIRSVGAFDLVLTDIVMAGPIDAGDIAATARAANPSVRVLFSSGDRPPVTDEGTSLRAADGFIAKPYRIDDLARAIAATLRGGADD